MNSHQIFETKLRINLRPITFAYFILDGDYDSLIRAITFICTQWGGIRHIIIPVKEDMTILPVFEEYIKIRKPEYFVSYLPDEIFNDNSKNNILIRKLKNLCPYQHISLNDNKYYERNDYVAHPLHVISEEDVSSRVLASFNYTGSKIDIAQLVAMFGTIYPEQEEDYKRYISLHQSDMSIDDYDQLFLLQNDSSIARTPINMTAAHLQTHQSGASDPLSFKVIVGDTVDSICVYWNMRAIIESSSFYNTDRRIILFPTRLIHYANIEKLIKVVRNALPIEVRSSDLDLAIIAFDEEIKNTFSDELMKIENVGELEGNRISFHVWIGHPEKRPREKEKNRKIKYRFLRPLLFESKSLIGAGRRSFAFKEVLKLGRNEIILNTPENFLNREHSTLAVDFDSDFWKRYPNDPNVSRLIISNAWFSDYGLTGAVNMACSPSSPVPFEINIPTEWEALKCYFINKGYEIQVSRNGQYANGVIELLGGIAEVGNISSQLAYDLLKSMALESSKKVAQHIIRKFPDAKLDEGILRKLFDDIEIVQELKRVSLTSEQLLSKTGGGKKRDEILLLLEKWAEKQIIKRGFTIECPNCKTPSLYKLDNLSEYLMCPGCSYKYVLPVLKNGIEIQWEYSLNSLVNRAIDQDVLPHIFALYNLTKEKESFCMIPGLEFIPKGEKNVEAEFDFIFICDQNIYAGECKASTKIGEKDLNTARFAARLGIQTFYFCTVKNFEHDSQKLIDKLMGESEIKNSNMKVETMNKDNLFE